MAYLPYKVFVPFAPEFPGTIRRDHGHGCVGNTPALRIERKENGEISAYCFRCHDRGFQGDPKAKFQAKKNKFLATPKPLKERKFQLPAAYTGKYAKFSTEALHYLNKYNIKLSEILEQNIGFHTQNNRLIFPIFTDGELVYYTSRQLVDDGYPRYIARRKSQEDPVGKLIRRDGDTVVVVEDLISGIKCARFHSAYVMYGSSIPDKYKLELMDFRKILIFMDNDSAPVKIKQGVLKNNFELYGKEVRLIKKDKDPKAYEDKRLEEVLANA